DPMRKLIFATAALAAGLGAFVSGASATATDIHAAMRLQAEAAAAANKAETAIDHVTTASISAGKARSAVKSRPAAGASAYDAIISRHAAKHGIPVSLARAVVRIESNFRPNARGRAGEIGL